MASFHLYGYGGARSDETGAAALGGDTQGRWRWSGASSWLLEVLLLCGAMTLDESAVGCNDWWEVAMAADVLDEVRAHKRSDNMDLPRGGRAVAQRGAVIGATPWSGLMVME